MAATAVADPFGDDPVEEVPLPGSPLVRALAQVRFPNLAALSTPSADATVGRIVEHLKDDYPIIGEQREAQLVMTQEGVTQTQGAKLWQMRSRDETWQVSLGGTFVALDTKAYTSRGDFARRLEEILRSVSEELDPPYAERLGVRYTNRIEEPERVLRIQELVRPEVLGGLAVPRPGDVALAHTLTESLYTIGSRMLHVRWGLLPPNAQIDPTLPAASSTSWILDLDSFVQDRLDFDASALAAAAERLASAAYRYFRWAVTEDFLKEFGGAA
jgi:uncharacterized protein (TIGR04255 family)